METDGSRIIWTIGHSTRSKEEFIKVLTSFDIQVLADVRRYPGSRAYPHFNVSALADYLPRAGIEYQICTDLGGRRKASPDSANSLWRNKSFRAYADYSETEEFKSAISNLTAVAASQRTAYMCSEAVWWRCHRAIISDILKAGGWKVMHITTEGKATEHPFTPVFRQVNNIP